MNNKYKGIRILDCSHWETARHKIVPYIETASVKEDYKFEFVYSRTIDKIKAFLTSSARNIKCNESLTDKGDLVYTPTTLEEVIEALKNTIITEDNINMYCKGAPITMDRRTRKIPFVFDKKIQYGYFIELLATQFDVNEELPKLKAQCYKIYTDNKTGEDIIIK